MKNYDNYMKWLRIVPYPDHSTYDTFFSLARSTVWGRNASIKKKEKEVSVLLSLWKKIGSGDGGGYRGGKMKKTN